LRDSKPDDTTENRRAKARVLASQQGQGQFRREAIRLLEGLSNQGSLTASDKFVLALLLDAEGRSRDASDHLAQLVQLRTRTPEYLFQYAMNLLARQTDLKKVQDVIGWLEDMERAREVGPNGFASVELTARLLEAQKKGDEAI